MASEVPFAAGSLPFEPSTAIASLSIVSTAVIAESSVSFEN